MIYPLHCIRSQERFHMKMLEPYPINWLNGPLQGRAAALDLDLSRANSLASEISSSTTNNYYQSQLADKINNKISDIMSLLTLTLSVHLNLDQNLIMNSSQSFESVVFFSYSKYLNKCISIVLLTVVNNGTIGFIWKFEYSIKYKCFHISFFVIT